MATTLIHSNGSCLILDLDYPDDPRLCLSDEPARNYSRVTPGVYVEECSNDPYAKDIASD